MPATGKPWEPDAQADVLLMGDSYANIYSQPAMGWGQAAGLAEHLSYELQRPIDSLTFNGGGTWTTRAELSRAENLDRLAVKRVVVYEFAIRDLLSQNWKLAPLASPAAILSARNSHRPQRSAELAVSAVSAPPSPYRMRLPNQRLRPPLPSKLSYWDGSSKPPKFLNLGPRPIRTASPSLSLQ